MGGGALIETTQPVLEHLQEQVRAARSEHTALRIVGGGTKDFYGGALLGERLDVAPLRGISSYEPTELVVTARAGTPLAVVRSAEIVATVLPPTSKASPTDGGNA